MRRIVKYSVWVVLIVISWSCEKIIDFNSDDVRAKMVINSVLCPDDLLVVSLMESNSVLGDNTYTSLDDRTVQVFKDNSLIETLIYGNNGNYFSENIYPTVGESYDLKVLNNGEEELTAKATVPIPIEIISVDTEMVKNDTWVELFITFKDPVNAGNYYKLSLEEKIKKDHSLVKGSANNDSLVSYKWIDLDQNAFLSSMGAVPNDGIVQDITFNKYYIFSDQIIDGKTFTLRVSTPIRLPDNNEPYSMVVNLQSLSEDYFYYLKSKTLYDALSNNSFVEPIGIMSNINNGMGIFGAMAPSKKEIIF